MSGWIVGPYDLFIGGVLMRGTYRRIAEHLTTGIVSGGRVLDIGSGPGQLVEAISRRRDDLQVIGIDPSADMVTRARRRTRALPNVQVRMASAEDLPLEDESVDAVVSSLSSHHWADRVIALDEQARVLRPGGRMWIVDLASHLPDQIEDQVADTGLRLTDTDSTHTTEEVLGPARRRLVLITARKPLAAA